jgi:hypothetical protein
VLVVDSLQTAPALGTAEATSPRERVDAVVAACKRVAARGALVLATCELARGAYRSRDAKERIDDLAAFKESGGIEYGATCALVLRSVPETPDLIDATFAKNRVGTKLDFRLRLDRARARVAEEMIPATPAETAEHDPRERAAQAAHEQLCRRVLAVVRGHPGALTSRNEIARKAGKSRRGAVLEAIRDLMDAGRLVVVGGAFRVAVPTDDPDRSEVVPAVPGGSREPAEPGDDDAVGDDQHDPEGESSELVPGGSQVVPVVPGPAPLAGTRFPLGSPLRGDPGNPVPAHAVAVPGSAADASGNQCPPSARPSEVVPEPDGPVPGTTSPRAVELVALEATTSDDADTPAADGLAATGTDDAEYF